MHGGWKPRVRSIEPCVSAIRSWWKRLRPNDRRARKHRRTRDEAPLHHSLPSGRAACAQGAGARSAAGLSRADGRPPPTPTTSFSRYPRWTKNSGLRCTLTCPKVRKMWWCRAPSSRRSLRRTAHDPARWRAYGTDNRHRGTVGNLHRRAGASRGPRRQRRRLIDSLRPDLVCRSRRAGRRRSRRHLSATRCRTHPVRRSTICCSFWR